MSAPPQSARQSAHPPSARKRHALTLFEGLPAGYDRMGALLSFGQDPRWRRALVRAIDPQPGQRVLDVATGTGLVTEALARRARCEIVALDQSQPMLAAARARLERDPELAARVTLVEGEAERLPFGDAEFDALAFTYLLRYVDDRAATMRELARVVKPGGRIGMVEFGVPPRARLRGLWRAHTRIGLPLVGRLVSPAWMEVGQFLGPNIEQLHRDEPDLAGLWRRAGIADVTLHRMSFGAGLVMTGVRDGKRAS
jgi:demethylmenaquinone methyltransferase/2-methoxy-6-polyprenyl-1,4-benzoquinol methylase